MCHLKSPVIFICNLYSTLSLLRRRSPQRILLVTGKPQGNLQCVKNHSYQKTPKPNQTHSKPHQPPKQEAPDSPKIETPFKTH